MDKQPHLFSLSICRILGCIWQRDEPNNFWQQSPQNKMGHSSFPYGLCLGVKNPFRTWISSPVYCKMSPKSRQSQAVRLISVFFLSDRNKMSTSLIWDEDTKRGSASLTVGLELKLSFIIFPGWESGELELVLAFLAANLLSNKKFIKLADSRIRVILASINKHQKIHIFFLALMADKTDVLFFHY